MSLEGRLVPERGAEPLERLDVGRIRGEPREAGADDHATVAEAAEELLDVGERRPAGLRHEDGELARLEDVAVEGDGDAVDPVEHRLRRVLNAPPGDELGLRWVGVPRTDQGDVLRVAGAPI